MVMVTLACGCGDSGGITSTGDNGQTGADATDTGADATADTSEPETDEPGDSTTAKANDDDAASTEAANDAEATAAKTPADADTAARLAVGAGQHDRCTRNDHGTGCVRSAYRLPWPVPAATSGRRL